MRVIQVTRTRVVQLVGFESRAPSNGTPTLRRPEIDDRLPGRYVVGMVWGDTIEVKFLRLAIDPNVALTLRSRNGHLSLPASAPTGDDGVLQIQTGTAQTADTTDDFVDVYWQSHLVGTLEVKIFRLIRVPVRFYFYFCVGSPTPTSSVDAVNMRRHGLLTATPNRYLYLTNPFLAVNAIWRSAGIQFDHPGGVETDTELVIPGIQDDSPRLSTGNSADLGTFLQTVANAGRYQSNAVNMYFIHRIQDASSSTLAITFPLNPWSDEVRAPRPCILVPLYYTVSQDQLNSTSDNGYRATYDATATGGISLDEYIGATLAHELGHYLGLRHPHDAVEGGGMSILGSKRLLMHNNMDAYYLLPLVRIYTGDSFNDNGVAEARQTARAHFPYG
ncbi:MAG: hypothetical protein U0271_38415 [Polyangiaceae bacterium]